MVLCAALQWLHRNGVPHPALEFPVAPAAGAFGVGAAAAADIKVSVLQTLRKGAYGLGRCVNGPWLLSRARTVDGHDARQ